MKLQLKILLPIIALMAILMGGSAYLSYTQSAESLEESLIDNLKGEAHSMQRFTNNLMETAVEGVERTAIRTDVVTFFDPGKRTNPDEVKLINNELQRLMESYPDFARFSILDLEGKVIASSDPSRVGTDHSSASYYSEAKAGRSFLSPPFQTPKTGGGNEISMAASTPVKKDGKIIGVAFGSIDLTNYYNKVIKPVSVGKSGFAYALDAQGRIVVHPQSDFVFKENLPATPIYRKMVSSPGDTSEILIGNNGEEVIVYYVTDPLSKLTLVVRADTADVFDDLGVMAKTSAIVTSVAILLGSILVILLVRPIVNALNRGVAFAEQIARGDLSGTLHVNRNDEIGALATALRTIPDALHEIVDEYDKLGSRIEGGELSAEGDASRFTGEFAHLIQGTNNILQRFRMIINNLPSPVAVFDKEWKASYLNNVAQEWAGSDYLGKTGQQLFNRADHGTEGCATARATQTGRSATAETKIHPRGVEMEVSYTSMPMMGADGKIAAILQLFTDLTAIKRTQRTIMDVASQALDISNRVATASEQLSAQVEQVKQAAGLPLLLTKCANWQKKPWKPPPK